MKDTIGVVHGRFQLLHNDHIRYILAGKEKCEHLVIGICNPDKSLTAYSSTNPHRSREESNPFTYYERYQMIKGSLFEMGIKKNEIDIVPFPINYPELIFNYAPRDAKYYMTIYDSWGYQKKKSLEEIGCSVEVLWEISLEEKGISGSYVRELIRNHQNWQKYVPKYVYEYVINNHLDEKMRIG